jgi:exonuclease III
VLPILNNHQASPCPLLANNQHLSFLLFNARSLNNKMPELHYLLQSYEVDVLCVTETWLHTAIANCTILNGCSYSIFRTDRPTLRYGGGVCIITKNSTTRSVSVALPPKFSHLELCVTDILSRYNRLRLFVCYQPPSADSDQVATQYVHDLCECMNSLYPANSTVLICDNLNLPYVDWSSDYNCLKMF